MTKEHDAIVKGVTNAFDYWLSQHDISTPECIQTAVEEAFDTWLARNSDELIAAIAKEIVTANKHRLAGLFDDVPPPRPEGRTVDCPYCGGLCADPASPGFVSIQGCDEMAAGPDDGQEHPLADPITGLQRGD